MNPDKAVELLTDLPDSLLKPVSGFEITARYRHDSQVWIGGDEIVAVIDTDKNHLTRLSDCRTIRFRSVVMGNDSVLWGGYGDMPAKLPMLGSNEGRLHFYYALDYTPLSGSTQYRYRLGNNQWSAWSERKDVEFLNLPYGSYTLSIQAQLADGKLSEVASVDFSVAYPLLLFILYLHRLSAVPLPSEATAEGEDQTGTNCRGTHRRPAHRPA